MLTTILAKLGMALFAAMPIERIVALLLNKWLSKLDGGKIDAAAANTEKAAKTAQHLAEIAELFAHIVEDKNLSEEEVKQVKTSVVNARLTLLNLWADGKSASDLQSELGKAGVDAAYVK